MLHAAEPGRRGVEYTPSREVALTTPVPPLPAVSPIDAAREALAFTRRQLFPIRVEKWLLLGVLAFLDQCGRSFRGGGSGSGFGGHDGAGFDTGDGPGAPGELLPWLQRAAEWLSAHAALVALGVLAVVVLVSLVAAVVLWVNSRGVFLYLDGVVGGKPAIVRPWRQHAAAAQSYFGWSLGLTLSGLALVLFAAGLLVTGVFAFATGRLHGGGAWLAAVAIVPILVLLGLALPLLALAALALRDFVAPLQLATGLPCGASARLLESLVMANPGAFVLYLVLKVLVNVVGGLAIVVFGCVTCCIGFLPVLMQILFQPLFFFDRVFPVFLLRQLGYDAAAALKATGESQAGGA
jgi:hypothetical protein